MKELMDNMLSKKVWAVVGATDNQSKFGYKIYKKLKNRGYEVYPVNPVYDQVDGDKCYSKVSDIPKKVDCVDVVVSPKRSMMLIDDCVEADVEYMWFQPHTFDLDVLAKAKSKKIKIVYNNCVLVQLG